MGMQEYHNGSFGPIKPVEESLKDLQENSAELAETKALHIGTVEDLANRARNKDIENPVQEQPLAVTLQGEISRLRMDVHKIMIHLGIDDKGSVLPVKDLLK